VVCYKVYGRRVPLLYYLFVPELKTIGNFLKFTTPSPPNYISTQKLPSSHNIYLCRFRPHHGCITQLVGSTINNTLLICRSAMYGLSIFFVNLFLVNIVISHTRVGFVKRSLIGRGIASPKKPSKRNIN